MTTSQSKIPDFREKKYKIVALFQNMSSESESTVKIRYLN